MTEKSQTNTEDEINLFDYLLLLLKNKVFIIRTTLVAMLCAAAVSFAIRPVYQAETEILPPQTSGSSMASAFASQMGAMGLPVSGLGVKTTADLYVRLLKTRKVLDYVIEQFGLMEKYKTASKDVARSKLLEGLVVSDDRKSGIIIVAFQHRDPQMAADIANAFVAGLQKLNNDLAVTEASQRRLFFEEQLKNAKENLIASEEALKNFQRRSGTIKLDDEAKGVIETVAKMRAGVSAKEVELRVMRSYATAQNPDLQRLESETAALKDELLRLESKSDISDDSVPTVGKMSTLGTEYVRKMREYKFHEALYEILLKQFEVAKLDESKSAALIQVVQRAESPERRIKPKRRHIVTNVGMIAFIISVLLIVLKDYFKGFVSDPRNREGLDKIMRNLDFRDVVTGLNLDSAYSKMKSLYQKVFHREHN